MLLNEYRLQPWTPQAQQFLVEQMEQFFFGEGSALPAGVRSSVALNPEPLLLPIRKRVESHQARPTSSMACKSGKAVPRHA